MSDIYRLRRIGKASMAAEQVRTSDGPTYKGYKVYGNGTIELSNSAGAILQNLFQTISGDLNIGLDNYIYDPAINRLVPVARNK